MCGNSVPARILRSPPVLSAKLRLGAFYARQHPFIILALCTCVLNEIEESRYKQKHAYVCTARVRPRGRGAGDVPGSAWAELSSWAAAPRTEAGGAQGPPPAAPAPLSDPLSDASRVARSPFSAGRGPLRVPLTLSLLSFLGV